MNTLLRWGKFNLVGAMGMGLQLALLAVSTAGRLATTCMPRLQPSNSRYYTTLFGICTTRGVTVALVTHYSVSWRGSISPAVWFRCWETSP
jgi:hypothetical protein